MWTRGTIALTRIPSRHVDSSRLTNDARLGARATLLCSTGAFCRGPDLTDWNRVLDTSPRLQADGLEVVAYPSLLHDRLAAQRKPPEQIPIARPPCRQIANER